MTGRRLALLLLAVIITAALLGPEIPGVDSVAQDRSLPLASPGVVHWLGTDAYGRDELARLLVGTRASLLAGLLATTLALLGGIVLGGLAGF